MSCLICNELLHDTITCGLIPVYLTLNTISPPNIVTQLPKPNKDLSAARPPCSTIGAAQCAKHAGAHGATGGLAAGELLPCLAAADQWGLVDLGAQLQHLVLDSGYP
jgi:hypothetical protein